jgi:hypothetical protein
MFRERVLGVLAKVETTSGVDAAPTGTDALRLAGVPDIGYGYLETGNRDDVVIGQLGRIGRAAPAGNFGTLRFRLEVRGAGSAYNGTSVLPEAHAPLIAAGLDTLIDTTGGAEKISYVTVDTGMRTSTFYVYTAGKLIKLIGCVANVDLTAAAMQRGFLDFTVTGKIASVVTETALPAQTLNATIPPLFHSVATTIGTYSSAAVSDPLVLRSAALHLGNTTSERPSAGATDGLIGYLVSDRVPRQDMVIETPLLTSLDAFALSKLTGTSLPQTTWQIGTAQYNRLRVFTGNWALEAPGLGADRGINTVALTGNLVQGTEPIAAREFRLVYD